MIRRKPRSGLISIQPRLMHALKAGNLTVADLARWFDRPDPTVREWLKGRQPTGAPLDVEHVYELLSLLETLIRKNLRFPIPRMSASEHKAYLLETRKRSLP